MRVRILTGMMTMLLATTGVALAHGDADKMPAGPIKDRHELMEGVGKNAKIIGDALKSGSYEPVAGAAQRIEAAAAKATALFPKGSTDPSSRAKPEIWQSWDKFEATMKEMGTTAAALAAAGKAGSGVPDAAQKMFATCKSCHDEFRVPEKKK